MFIDKKDKLFSLNLKKETEEGLHNIQLMSSILLKQKDLPLLEICKKVPHVFLHPFFYSAVTGVSSFKLIEQSVIGLLPIDILNYRKIKLYSNKDRVLYIPYLGYKKTPYKNQEFFAEAEYLNTDNWESERTIDKTIVVHTKPNIYFDFIFKNKDFLINCDMNNYYMAKEAIHIIKETSSNYYCALKLVTKNITLFESKTLNSFAVSSIFGNAFINVKHGNTLPYFIEDLAHQCGHIVFTSLTNNGECLFNINPTKAINKLLGKEDHRNIHTLFHGLFTYSTILECLSNSLSNEDNKLKNRKETYWENSIFTS